jgi:hypothetical protein
MCAEGEAHDVPDGEIAAHDGEAVGHGATKDIVGLTAKSTIADIRRGEAGAVSHGARDRGRSSSTRNRAIDGTACTSAAREWAVYASAARSGGGPAIAAAALYRKNEYARANAKTHPRTPCPGKGALA